MLKSVEKEIESLVAQLGDKRVLDLYRDLPAGKRLRSRLILKICDSKECIKLAALIEMIHAASLLHDDVIDDAETRRGKASINAVYGDKTAIMLGDILYSKAFFELTDFPGDVAKTVSNAVVLLSMGEMMDVDLAKAFNTDLDLYLDMVYKKTASLIEASAACAAILAGLEPQPYALYGKNLGIAFQIVDDILDIVGDEKSLGKPAMNDYKEGKTTMPYIYLYESLDENGRARLESLFAKEPSFEDKAWIKESMIKYGAVKKAMDYAVSLGEEALAALPEKNGDLQEIMKKLIYREY